MELNMINSLLFIALCFSTIDADNTPVSNCHCTKVGNTTEQLNFQRLQTYSVQHQPPCPIKAIRFKTKKGIFLCSNPEIPRIKAAMEYLDNNKKRHPKTQSHKQGPSSEDQTTSSAQQEYETASSNLSTTPTVQLRGPTASIILTPDSTPSIPTATSPSKEKETGSTSPLPIPPTTRPSTTQTQSTTTQQTPTTTMSTREGTNPVTRSSAADVTESTSSKPAPPTHQRNLTTATVKHHDAPATVTKAPANVTVATSSPVVMRQSTASTTRFKMASWLARRRNRGKKPGLRKKQRAMGSYHRD